MSERTKRHTKTLLRARSSRRSDAECGTERAYAGADEDEIEKRKQGLFGKTVHFAFAYAPATE
eukprot:2284709-Rhodomonas_salina.12